MPRGRTVQARNPIGQALATRRAELGIPRGRFRWRYRLEQVEGTSKLARAVRLVHLEGSEEFLDPLGFTLEDLDLLAAGAMDQTEALERARQRQPADEQDPATIGS